VVAVVVVRVTQVATAAVAVQGLQELVQDTQLVLAPTRLLWALVEQDTQAAMAVAVRVETVRPWGPL
jgi:hypothetical protein